MRKIIGANKDVNEETLFLGAEIPKYGVITEHEAELEKVRIFFNFGAQDSSVLLLIMYTISMIFPI